MPVTSRTLFELTIPLIAVYIFIGAPELALPDALRPYLPFPSARDRSASTATPFFTESNLAWALDTLAIPSDPAPSCAPAPYTTHVYSTDPLVLYLDDFLSGEEASALSALAEPLYAPSTIFSSTGAGERNDSAVRRSEKAALPRTADVVRCVEERARTLQGWPADLFVERLWAQRYAPGGHYAPHFDFGSADGRRGGRVSSFMVWLDDGCEGGATHFPRLPRREAPEWCGRVECGPDAQPEGTAFRPRKGSAVFWENFRADGLAHEESWHAGLPVTQGTKVGLNIWSWQQEGLGAALEEYRARKRDEEGIE